MYDKNRPSRPRKAVSSSPDRPERSAKPASQPAAPARTGREQRFSCPVAAHCGGCQLSRMSYAEQLRHKQQVVQELLGGLCPVEEIIGMADPYHYRGKVHAVLSTDKRGIPYSGVYAMGTHRVVPVKNCLIEDKRADRIIQTIVSMLPRYKLRIYNEYTHRGFLRHILVRTANVTGQVMVVLVATGREFPGGKAFVAELVKTHPEITTVVLNVNTRETSMVLGKTETALYGPGYMEDELCGKRFRISPQSFYQVNLRQTEVLYRTAIEYAGLTGGETLLDAYCGTGTIGLCASDHVRKLIGVELNADAVRDAKENARLNGVSNARFFCDDAGRFMVRMAQEGQPLDVLIMDPPRAGSDEKFLSSVLTLRPPKVVYVSCNPETLARDAEYLVQGGYRAVKAVPVDMFPCTEHVETVMLFTRPDA
ncbi:MAG: 23S rRNA (uracil(1939)-C(5))-methyltransferase RlmD [Clostridiales bacterium]|nr:23S rRNA (uracil(1939)-C(5))-methyltransferase RlmD [Clostridiales bacterium]